MRNIAVFTVLVIMLGGAQFIAAQEETPNESPYTFSVLTSFGIFLGQAEEIVYPPSEFKANKLSQLLWDIKPVFYNSLSLDVSRTRPMEKWGFISALSMKIGFPGKSGKMEDRDWMSIENDALTNYSIHDNHTSELLIFDASAGLSFPFNQVLIKTYFAMSYMRFSFSGMDGYRIYAQPLGGGSYASIDDNPDYESLANRGKLINYTQNWLTAAQGVSLAVFFNHFYSEFFFSMGPVIFCIDVDEHLAKNTVYKDYMYGGVFIEPGFRFSFIANRRLEFSSDFSWRYMGGTRGATWVGSPIGTPDMTQDGEAGAGLSLFNIGLSMKVYLRH